MSKGGSSTTETTIPDWLSGALRPLLAQSARNAQVFGAQGNNILQGLPAGGAPVAPPAVPPGGSGAKGRAPTLRAIGG